MNIITRILTFPDRLLYRWGEDELAEIVALRDKLADEGVPAVALALEVGMVKQLTKLTNIANRLRARGVGVDDYAMGNLEMAWSVAGVALWILWLVGV